MKTAEQYAQQALRFAERVTADVDALRRRFNDMVDDGVRFMRHHRVDEKLTPEDCARSARKCAQNAARYARLAQAGCVDYPGWRPKDFARLARNSAAGAARCSGYAEASA